MAHASHDRPSPSPFDGFADPSMRFFRELDSHQDRAWFIEHKALYEEQWSRPLAALLAQVSPRVALLKLKGLALGFPAIPTGMIGTAGFADWLVDRSEETAPAVQKLARLLEG